MMVRDGDRGCGWKTEGCDMLCGPLWTGGVGGRRGGAEVPCAA